MWKVWSPAYGSFGRWRNLQEVELKDGEQGGWVWLGGRALA